MQAISIISSRTLCIGIHTCHRHIYLLWLASICTVFWRLIYFCRSVCTSFRIFCFPVNFLIRSVRFWKICDEIILWSTIKARICFPTITLITLIIGVVCIKWWFLIAILIFLLLKEFFSWMWNSTVTAPWLRKMCSLIIYDWIVQIQIIDL